MTAHLTSAPYPRGQASEPRGRGRCGAPQLGKPRFAGGDGSEEADPRTEETGGGGGVGWVESSRPTSDRPGPVLVGKEPPLLPRQAFRTLLLRSVLRPPEVGPPAWTEPILVRSRNRCKDWSFLSAASSGACTGSSSGMTPMPCPLRPWWLELSDSSTNGGRGSTITSWMPDVVRATMPSHSPGPASG